MKTFHQIIRPQQNIVADNFGMDLFSADLWDVYKGRAPQEYADSEVFFSKSYQSDVMEQLCKDVAKRLKLPKGDSVFCLKGAAGTGKTHALINLYHRAQDWKAKPLVIVGTTLEASDTLWGSLEEQLRGKREHFRDMVSPGREALRTLLKEKAPVMILIDELLHYVTKAATVQVGESTLAAQTLAFLQELSEVISSIKHVALVISLPSGPVGNYDEQAAWFWGQFQKILGRLEKIYTPVRRDEFPSILRRRVFADLDREALDEFLDAFMEYALAESLVPVNMEPSEYRSRFEASYPFLPETLVLLFQRWGAFPAFQEFRGMLRVLSLVVAGGLEMQAPYLSLADFDLSSLDLQREMLRHVGGKFADVLNHDILAEKSGAKHVDAIFAEKIGELALGTRLARTIFLCSFSSSEDLRGVGTGDIRRQASSFSLPGHLIREALLECKNFLHYLHVQQNAYAFHLHPNLNHLLMRELENVDELAIEELEKELLKKCFPPWIFETSYWPDSSNEVPDSPYLKLVILRQADSALMREVLSMKGNIPRINQNTIFFIAPIESDRSEFSKLLKQFLAWGMLLSGISHSLSPEQRKEVKNRWKQAEIELDDAIRYYYHRLFVPTENDLRERDLSVMPHDGQKSLDQVCYELLVSEGEILEHLEPSRFNELCLQERPFVFTEQLFRLSTTTLGNPRVADKQVCEAAIKDGVRQGIFGLGVLRGKDLICDSFRQEVWGVDFSNDEVIIREDFCQRSPASQNPKTDDLEALNIENTPSEPELKHVNLRFKVPHGKVSQLMSVFYALRRNFDTLTLEIEAEDGRMSLREYTLSIEETLKILNIEAEELGSSPST